MILTDREIELALASKHIQITPHPDKSAYSSTSVDLTLDGRGRIWRAIGGMTINPGRSDYSYRKIEELQQEVAIPHFPLAPQAFLLAWTREVIALPRDSRIAARVEGKSSLARIGIAVHVTAPTIHAGFRGPIQLEIVNHGPLTIVFDEGMPVCQLIFEQTFGTPGKGYIGMFLDQKP